MLNISVHPRTGEALLAPAPAPARPPERRIWEIRTEEQAYAFLPETPLPDANRYGQKIDLIEHVRDEAPHLTSGRSLHINDNPAVGANPNRNKQHGFFFTADNCIGCHACEAACSEKNENPPHLAFRSVGYVEGGSYPDYKRLNISMACNHCDDPVCLKGCPTRAYTKHTEYGAVLQDPETCFGCGYCTWVCPYNAPQLDPVKGQVSKCNMCVDRLEVGLKPACVAACVGNALDFGVIETVPAGREQARVEIPGFPSAEVTHPNIRFQQIKQLPDELTRTDSMPVKYHKDERGSYRPAVHQKIGREEHWNLARLSSRENPLVLFTLAAQAVIGAFALQFLGALAGAGGVAAFAGFAAFAASPMVVPLAMLEFALVALGLFMSTLHLGKPKRFYRGFNNLRHSPVSREGLGIALFIAGLGGHIAFALPANAAVQTAFGTLPPALARAAALASLGCGALAIVAGAVGLFYMTRCYRIQARPFWNHWQVATAFGGNALALGSVLVAAVVLPTLLVRGAGPGPVAESAFVCSALMVLGLAIEGIGHVAHAKALGVAEHEGGASYYVQCTTFGKTYRLRNALLGFNLLLALAAATAAAAGLAGLVLWAALAVAALLLVATSVIGRALFYVLVIPTTMPGAFFWKNKGFEEHARAVGLAHLPQVGVVPLRH
jgi:DMSO reductase iron-sulfur subunit